MSNTSLTLQIGGDISKLRAEINKANGLMGGFKNNLSRVGGLIAGAFSAAAVVGFGKAVYDVTAEFQKFEAVLNTSLGSNSRAQLAMKQIEEFAAATPFSVKELTGSFVKLANQGFVPTAEEMRKLGDLAASTGKSFDQLTEAIIDAQTGEFERLKEFGIRAKKEGDKVIFTFKGVQTQTEFTSEAIQKYVLSLGDAVGISGSMAAISDTVGGKISNLGDSWDQLLKVLGDQSSGPFKNAINNLNSMLQALTEAVKTSEQLQDDLNLKGASRAISTLQTLELAYGDLTKASKDYLRLLEGQLSTERKFNRSLSRLDDNNEQRIKDSYSKIHLLEAQIKAVTEYVDTKSLESAAKLLEAANKYQAAYQKIKSLPFITPKVKRGNSEEGDEFPHPEIDMNPNSSLLSRDEIEDPVAGIVAQKESYDLLLPTLEELNTLQQERIDKMHAEAEMAVTMGAAMGELFTAMIKGEQSFAQALAKITEQIITLYLQQSIAGMIKSAIDDKTTDAIPFAKIAVAAAGIAAVKGLFSQIGGGSGGGGGSYSPPGRTPSEMDVRVGGVIKGNDLHIMNNRTAYRKSWTG